MAEELRNVKEALVFLRGLRTQMEKTLETIAEGTPEALRSIGWDRYQQYKCRLMEASFWQNEAIRFLSFREQELIVGKKHD